MVAMEQESPSWASVREALDEALKRLWAAERRALETEDKLLTLAEKPAHILIADPDDRLYRALAGPAARAGMSVDWVATERDALKQLGTLEYQLVLLGGPSGAGVLPLKNLAPDLVVVTYALGDHLTIVEPPQTIPLVEKFTSANQIYRRLGELIGAYHARSRERRYLRAFYSRHEGFLKRLGSLAREIGRYSDTPSTTPMNGKLR